MLSRFEFTGNTGPSTISGQAPLSQEQLQARIRWNDFNENEQKTFDTVSTRQSLSHSCRTSKIHRETADTLGSECFGPQAPTPVDAQEKESGHSTFMLKWRDYPPPNTVEEADTLIRSKLVDRYAVARQLEAAEDRISIRFNKVDTVASDPGQAAVGVLDEVISTVGNSAKTVAYSLSGSLPVLNDTSQNKDDV